MERNYINFIRPYLKELNVLSPIPTGVQPHLGRCKAKAVIFDIYGTLLISASGDVEKAEYDDEMMRKSLKTAQYDIVKDTALSQIYALLNLCLKAETQARKEAGTPYPEVDIVAIWERVLQSAEKEGLIRINQESNLLLFIFTFELQSNKIWPMPHLQNVIKKLSETDLALGIVSNAQFYTPVIMNHFLYNVEKDCTLISPFEKELTIYSYQKLRGKPDVALFEDLIPHLSQRGISPHEAVFVGNDMLKDVYAASQAGFKTVLFAGDKRSLRLRETDNRCANLHPDFVITALPQLLEILDL